MVDVSDITYFDKQEDRLTATLIMTLEHSTEEVLRTFLGLFGVREDIEGATFGLQIQEVGSVPDAKIEGKSFLIYIESKLDEDIDADQITNHFLGGKGKKSTFFVFCITGGFSQPEGILRAEKHLQEKGETPNFKWINWKRLYSVFQRIEPKDEKSNFLLQSFNSTLEKMDLVGFTMFEREELMATGTFVEKYNNLLNKCNLLSEEITGRLKQKGIKFIGFDRNGRSKSCDTITFSSYYYNKEDWEPSAKWKEGSYAWFLFEFDEAKLQLGAEVYGKTTIYKKDADWGQLFELIPPLKIAFTTERSEREEVGASGFLRKVEETRTDQTLNLAEIYVSEIDMKTLKPDIPQRMITEIIEILNALEKNNLYLVEINSHDNGGTT